MNFSVNWLFDHDTIHVLLHFVSNIQVKITYVKCSFNITLNSHNHKKSLEITYINTISMSE